MCQKRKGRDRKCKSQSIEKFVTKKPQNEPAMVGTEEVDSDVDNELVITEGHGSHGSETQNV
jgi:hypothetical protein